MTLRHLEDSFNGDELQKVTDLSIISFFVICKIAFVVFIFFWNKN